MTANVMQKTIDFINQKMTGLNITPKIGIVLGSGLSDIVHEIDGINISYSEIPGFEDTTVEGHTGMLAVGRLCGKDVIAMKGRFHFYEGYSMTTIVYPVRIMKYLGIDTLIVTNAAGGINISFNPGDLMLIMDHINLMGNNPLIGKNINELGPRFVDMSYAYNEDLINLTQKIAMDLNIKLQKGIYAAMTGPVYETPAEIRMLRSLGADAVGMSTAPEVIAANHMGVRVLGISCIANMAAGILDKSLSHNEVIETTAKIKQDFIRLIKSIIKNT